MQRILERRPVNLDETVLLSLGSEFQAFLHASHASISWGTLFLFWGSTARIANASCSLWYAGVHREVLIIIRRTAVCSELELGT